MDAETAGIAHPAFVEVIRQLTPDEARVMTHLAEVESIALVDVEASSEQGRGFVWLRNFSHLGDVAGCEQAGAVSTYIDNLIRLRLVEIPVGYQFGLSDHYEPILAHPTIQRVCAVLRNVPDRIPYIYRKALFITTFGAQFCNACGMPVRGIRERVLENEGIDFLDGGGGTRQPRTG